MEGVPEAYGFFPLFLLEDSDFALSSFFEPDSLAESFDPDSFEPESLEGDSLELDSLVELELPESEPDPLDPESPLDADPAGDFLA